MTINISSAAAWFKRESVTILHALNAAVVLLGAFSFGLSHSKEAALVTIASSLVTIVTSLTTRPVSVALLKGAATTLLTVFIAFGLKLSPEQIASYVAAAYIALGYLLRLNVSPAGAATAPPGP
jgi:hypothetical protein